MSQAKSLTRRLEGRVERITVFSQVEVSSIEGLQGHMTRSQGEPPVERLWKQLYGSIECSIASFDV